MISVEKTNVMYAGVDNPLSILVRGVPEDQIQIKAEGMTLKKEDNFRYTARPAFPGEAKIMVSGGNLEPVEFKYRVKRFPDPTMYIGRRRGGTMGAGEFCGPGGLSAVISGMDICGNCETVRYDVTRLTKEQDPVTKSNTGARFDGGALSLIQLARPGDRYLFENIKVRCPGDSIPRQMENISITIQ